MPNRLLLFAVLLAPVVAFALLGDIAAIRDARKLLLEKDRLGALSLLREAMKLESDPKRRGLLQKEITNSKNLFFTNEGQKIFEQAESARYSGDKQVVARYEAALKLEPGNALVLEALILAKLETKDCPGARASLTELRALDMDAESTALLTLAAYSCDLNSEEPAPVEIRSKDFRHYEKAYRARVHLAQSKLDSAIRFSNEAIQLNSDYPTPHFIAWKAKVASNDGAQAEEQAERFLELCAEGQQNLKRKFRYDPWLCREVEEVKAYLSALERAVSQ